MRIIYLLFISVSLSMMLSCKKTDSVQAGLEGTWERVVFEHSGSEKWTFTSDFRIEVVLDLPSAGIVNENVADGTYELSIVNYSHGKLLNKNILKVAAITINGLQNFKYGNSNIYFPANNTQWEVHQLDNNVLIITTQTYDGIPGGLVMKEFYRE